MNPTANEIVATAVEEGCGMIVMGCKQQDFVIQQQVEPELFWDS